MSGKKRLAIGALCAAAGGFAAMYVAGRARAAGVPTIPPAMTYSGTLTQADGTPLTGSKNIGVEIWDQPTGGTTPVCLAPSSMQTLVAGSFQVALPDTCAAAVHANPDLWIEVSIDGAALARTKIGAVPYALESATASAAAGALAASLNALVPPKAIITANLAAADISSNFDATGLGKSPGPYAGWAICNGGNGTPNLAGRFLRVNATAAGATGGSDSSAHTHTTPAHQHLIPIGWDTNNQFFTSDATGLPLYGSTVITARRYPPGMGTQASDTTRLAYTDNSGAGTTGAASVTDNRPAYYELVALMRM
jgi:hypothetical protein